MAKRGRPYTYEWKDADNDIRRLVRANPHNISEALEQVSKKYSFPFTAVQKRYYTHIRPNIGQRRNKLFVLIGRLTGKSNVKNVIRK